MIAVTAALTPVALLPNAAIVAPGDSGDVLLLDAVDSLILDASGDKLLLD